MKNVVAAARVVLATCHSAGSRQINNMTFDYCIIDEATQAVEAVCWVPILKSNKVILAGDPQQVRAGRGAKLNYPLLTEASAYHIESRRASRPGQTVRQVCARLDAASITTAQNARDDIVRPPRTSLWHRGQTGLDDAIPVRSTLTMKPSPVAERLG